MVLNFKFDASWLFSPLPDHPSFRMFWSTFGRCFDNWIIQLQVNICDRLEAIHADHFHIFFTTTSLLLQTHPPFWQLSYAPDLCFEYSQNLELSEIDDAELGSLDSQPVKGRGEQLVLSSYWVLLVFSFWSFAKLGAERSQAKSPQMCQWIWKTNNTTRRSNYYLHFGRAMRIGFVKCS